MTPIQWINEVIVNGIMDFGGAVLLVLTSAMGVMIAYFLFKFAWRAIIGSVSPGSFLNFQGKVFKNYIQNRKSRKLGFGQTSYSKRGFYTYNKD